MRVLPLALWHRGPDEDLVALAMRQALPTHGHGLSRVACAQYCLWARAELHGHPAAWDHAATRLRDLLPDSADTPVDRVLDPANAEAATGRGYMIDTLWSAKAAVEKTTDYAGCVRWAIGLGWDTDTTVCVAGGIAGMRYGACGTPIGWVEGLRGMDIVDPLIKSLFLAFEKTLTDSG